MTTQQRKMLEEYLAQFDPENLTEHDCPHCETRIGAPKPKSDSYTTVVKCPDCGGLFHREIFPDGSTVCKTDIDAHYRQVAGRLRG